MNFLIRFFKRITIITVNITIFWLVVTQVFGRLDERLPFFVALILTYFVSAYIILPQIVRTFLLVFRKGRIPRFTRATDGFYIDPVNIILTGSKDEL